MRGAILVPSAGPDAWRALLASPGTQWREGRSAMSAALSWERAQGTTSGLSPEVAALLGPSARLVLAIPEHKVPLPGGRRDSQCDVFALVDLGEATCALAVEAKVNEPFGPTVEEWMAEASPGKAARLAAIMGLLGLAAVPEALRYQLLHRTASAVLEARRFRAGVAAMVVQSFAPDRRWFADFAGFCEVLGLKAEPDRPLTVPLPDGLDLILGWASCPLPRT